MLIFRGVQYSSRFARCFFFGLLPLQVAVSDAEIAWADFSNKFWEDCAHQQVKMVYTHHTPFVLKPDSRYCKAKEHHFLAPRITCTSTAWSVSKRLRLPWCDFSSASLVIKPFWSMAGAKMLTFEDSTRGHHISTGESLVFQSMCTCL